MELPILIALTHKGEIAGGGCTVRYLNRYLRKMECPTHRLWPSWSKGRCTERHCPLVAKGRGCTRHKAVVTLDEGKLF
jgi:hypothetical protein